MKVSDSHKNMDLRSVKAFRSKDEYLVAMKEDLAEWLSELHGVDINVDNFFDVLDTGCLLCTHANTILSHMNLPQTHIFCSLPFRKNAQIGSFQARDNLALFISFCRKELKIPDTLLFESEDLVCRKNDRSVVLCLLEVGRRGASFGVMVPQLVRLEHEIDQEIENEKMAQNRITSSNFNNSSPSTPCLNLKIINHKTPSYSRIQSHYKFDKTRVQSKTPKKYVEVDMMTLDEMVRLILGRCTCEQQYPMIRLSEGKYTFGDNLTPIFLRVLRRHVMVRTGGGWDTLESFLGKHDPCRCDSKDHRGALAFKNAFKKKFSTEVDGSVTNKFFGISCDQSSVSDSKPNRTATPVKHSNDASNTNENTLHLLNNVKHLIGVTNPVGKKTVRPKTANNVNRTGIQLTGQAFKRTLNANSYVLNGLTRSRTTSSSFLQSFKSLHSSNESLAASPNLSRRKSTQLFEKATPQTKGAISKKLNATSVETSKNNKSNHFKTPLRPRSTKPKNVESKKFKQLTNVIECSDRKLSQSAEILASVNPSVLTNAGNKKKTTMLNNINYKNIQQKNSKSLNTSKENILGDFNSSRKQIIQNRTIPCSRSSITSNSVREPPNSAQKVETTQKSFNSLRPISAQQKGTESEKHGRTFNIINSSQTPHKRFSSVEDVSKNKISLFLPTLRPRIDVVANKKTKIPGPVNMRNDNFKRSDSGVDITGAIDEADSKTGISVFFGKNFY